MKKVDMAKCPSFASRTYFGLQWHGWYFVFNTLPFGSRLATFVLMASHVLNI